METNQQVVMIPMDSINDPEWNSRLDVKEDKELATLSESIREHGLLSPILVEEYPVTTVTAKNGAEEKTEFLLIAGSRRRLACKRLGMTTIPAFIRKESDKTQRTILNISENVHRKDLSAYELGRACFELREQKVSAADVAKRVGLSASRVYQLVQAFATLPNDIKQDWAKQEPVLTAPFIQELVALKDPDKQVKEYKERKALVEKLDAVGEKKNKAGEKPRGKSSNRSSVKVEFITVAKLKKALDKSKNSVVAIALAKSCIDFLIGKVSEIDGVIESPQVGAKGIEAPKTRNKEKE